MQRKHPLWFHSSDRPCNASLSLLTHQHGRKALRLWSDRHANDTISASCEGQHIIYLPVVISVRFSKTTISHVSGISPKCHLPEEVSENEVIDCGLSVCYVVRPSCSTRNYPRLVSARLPDKTTSLQTTQAKQYSLLQGNADLMKGSSWSNQLEHNTCINLNMLTLPLYLAHI